MSLWTDLQNKSLGQPRKEDLSNNLWEFADPIIGSFKSFKSQPITFIGTMGPEGLDKIPHSAGRYCIVKNTCSCNGQQFNAGDLIMDDGSTWQIIGHSDCIGNSYIGQ